MTEAQPTPEPIQVPGKGDTLKRDLLTVSDLVKERSDWISATIRLYYDTHHQPVQHYQQCIEWCEDLTQAAKSLEPLLFDALAASINRYRQGRPTATGEPAPFKTITGADAKREKDALKHIAKLEIQIRDKLNNIRHG